MTRTILLAIFATVILLTGTVATPLGMYQTADAVKSKGNESTVINSKKVCGDRLCSDPKAPVVKKSEKKEETKTVQKAKEESKATTVPPTKDNKAEVMKEAKMSEKTVSLTKTVTGTMKSSKDPGLGHENHQLAIILPPSDKVYRGHLTYTASEPVQLVALHGPLKTGKDRGQPIWSTDGTTKYGMTFVDDQRASGVWQFAGNALAVHTMKKEPFTVTYSVTYTENVVDNVKAFRGTISSEKDPGLGHENHQLAMILPPSDKAYRGTLTYDASEPIQLISLIGPIKEGEIHPPTTWSPDGKTIYGMIFVDPKKSAGTWIFSGNALAVHTTKTTPFTVSYSVVLTE
ncbi:MAG: hypothetical protein DWQ18_03185 [Crenarchaeota archaeon]|nr:MAG: hypothetical protein DWQ17_05345 [Thermoproteota archaeon]RDJ33929.1 MAG: hypothetical protein DWQ18_03185 [Thermoproteota archaeon]RDJ36959.1 MAG: hypothetical protein DWQ13_07435 [Thermoproteota archaeon]RDJ37506.1 MAG: hypothetical protein DWQ19_03400 [Thermoproteota archaeon]